MLVLEAWGNRASSFWTTNRTSTFLDKAEPSSRASRTSFRASSCIAGEEKLEGGCRDREKDSKRCEGKKITHINFFDSEQTKAKLITNKSVSDSFNQE